MIGATVETGLFPVLNLETELGGNLHLCTKRGERFTDKFLVSERPIHFSSVEECDTAFDCGPNYRDTLLPIDRWAEAEAHSHAAETHG